MIYNRIAYLVLLGVFVLSFSSCKTDQTASIADPVIDIALKEDPTRLNPVIYPGAVARLVHQHIFLPCGDYHPETLELYPILLKEIPDPEYFEVDGVQKVRYSCSFKEDAQWDDGTPITGKDYLFTFKMIMHPEINTSAYKSYLIEIENVVVDENDPTKFTVTFRKEYLLTQETAVTIPIFPHHIYDPNGHMLQFDIDQVLDEEFMTNATNKDAAFRQWVDDMNGMKYSREVVNNCGPYQLDSWETDKNLVLTKKENYWGSNYPDNPFLQQGPDKMIFYIIPDPTTALAQLKAGEIDVMNYLSSKQFVDLRDNTSFNQDFDFFSPVLRRYYYLGINNSDPILSDPQVREALGHLLDVDKIIENIDYGMGKRIASLVHPDRKYYNTKIKAPEFSIEKAKSILEAAGWKDSDGDGDLDKAIGNTRTDLDIELYVTQQELGRQVGLMLQENARQVGININIITKSFAAIRDEHLKPRDYGITPMVINQDLNDDDFYNSWHSENDTPSKRNMISYRDDEADEIIEAIRTTTDKNKRYQLYEELQEVVYEDHPVIFLYAPMEKIVVRKSWNGSATVKRPGYMANTFRSGKE
jgi:peptide/nickel transport system substrate-binding protein